MQEKGHQSRAIAADWVVIPPVLKPDCHVMYARTPSLYCTYVRVLTLLTALCRNSVLTYTRM